VRGPHSRLTRTLFQKPRLVSMRPDIAIAPQSLYERSARLPRRGFGVRWTSLVGNAEQRRHKPETQHDVCPPLPLHDPSSAG
jgi:hypothetical protein